MLMYRSCRCCRRIANKLLHTVFHLLAMPCIALAFIATYDSHNLRTVPCKTGQCDDPIPNFYSLHSWMGLATMGLFALQVIQIVAIALIYFFITKYYTINILLI